MKDILTAPFVKEMMETTANMYRLGWDERNGGNVSLLLSEAEVADYVDTDKVSLPKLIIKASADLMPNVLSKP